MQALHNVRKLKRSQLSSD